MEQQTRDAGAAAVERLIERYNAAWNAHDLDAIVSMHAPGMVFENHTAGERAEGEAVREHIAAIFRNWPDLRFEARRLYAREGLAVCEWTARATHSRPIERDGRVLEASGREITWDGVDVFPIEDGLIARKDVYSDALSVLRQLGAL